MHIEDDHPPEPNLGADRTKQTGPASIIPGQPAFHFTSPCRRHDQPHTSADTCKQSVRSLPAEQVTSRLFRSAYMRTAVLEMTLIRMLYRQVRLVSAVFIVPACEHRLHYDRSLGSSVYSDS